MRAIYCTKYGPPEVLKIKEVEKPIPKAREIRVRVKAVTAAVADIRVRGFQVPSSYRLAARLALGIFKPRNPVLGIEYAGIVDAVGKDVKRFQPGEAVFGSNSVKMGSYAEYICVPENAKKRSVAHKPSNLSIEESAAVPLGGLTALYFLKQANIQKGQKVLIYGASGSVGSYAVQLASSFGAEVTAVCSTSNQEWVKDLGADHMIDYTREDYTKNGEMYDVIFETVGKSSIQDGMKSLKEKGTFLHAVAIPANMRVMRKAARGRGIKIVGGGPGNGLEELLFLKKLSEEGSLKPIIDRTYSMEEISDAHAYVELGHKKGNVVVRFS